MNDSVKQMFLVLRQGIANEKFSEDDPLARSFRRPGAVEVKENVLANERKENMVKYCQQT